MHTEKKSDSMNTGNRILRRLRFNLCKGRSLTQAPPPELGDKNTDLLSTRYKVNPFDVRLYVVPAGIVGCIFYPQYMVEIFTDLGCLAAGLYVAAKQPRIPETMFWCLFPLMYRSSYNRLGEMGMDHDDLGYAARMLTLHDSWKAVVLTAVLLAVLFRCLIALYFRVRDDEKPIGGVAPFELPECSAMPE